MGWIMNNFKFKKRLGQHFLIDNNIINNIVSEASISKDTLVLEIGAGAGALTNRLVEEAKYVIAYEIDKSLASYLNKLLAKYNNLKIIYDDFLKHDINKDIANYQYNELLIIGNLPYYISTPIINKIIDDSIPVNKIVIMIQKEVGERITAKPGTKEYSSLSIYIDYYFEVKKLFIVNHNVFRPKPAVDSVVIKLEKRQKPKVKVLDEQLFFKLIRDAFTFKRKNIRNNLRQYDLSVIEEVLKKYHLDLTVRAEYISIDIFTDLANNLTK